MRKFLLTALFVTGFGHSSHAGIIAIAEARNSTSLLEFDVETGSGDPLTVNAGVFAEDGAQYRGYAEGTTVGKSLLFRFENGVSDPMGKGRNVFTSVVWDDRLVGTGSHTLTFRVHGQVDIIDAGEGNLDQWQFSVDSQAGSTNLATVRATGTDVGITGNTSFSNLLGWDSFVRLGATNEFNGLFSVVVPGETDFMMDVRSNAFADIDGQVLADLLNTVELVTVKDSSGAVLNSVNFASGFQFQLAAVPEPGSVTLMTLAAVGIFVRRRWSRRSALPSV